MGGGNPLQLPVLSKDCFCVFKQVGLVQAGGMLLLCSSMWFQPSHAAQPRIIEVPAGPAFVRLPGASEIKARSGQNLITNTLLKTNKPGRMQVLLGNGRHFRMGGDAQLRLGSSNVELLKGSIIGWIQPGTSQSQPFSIKTRLATASIQGTTVFIDYTGEQLKIFSWEGVVSVETQGGQQFTLTSGQQLLLDLKDQMDEQEVLQSSSETGKEKLVGQQPRAISEVRMIWEAPKSIAAEEAQRRLEMSPLINGFSTPIDTLTVIQSELGLTAPKQNTPEVDSYFDKQNEY